MPRILRPFCRAVRPSRTPPATPIAAVATGIPTLAMVVSRGPRSSRERSLAGLAWLACLRALAAPDLRELAAAPILFCAPPDAPVLRLPAGAPGFFCAAADEPLV